MRRTMLFAVAALLLAAMAPGQAEAQFGYPYPQRGMQVPQGVGCYWFRGNLNCSRYCYWEIDGYRYCTRRLRDAYSQAPYLAEGPAPYAPARRPRPAK